MVCPGGQRGTQRSTGRVGFPPGSGEWVCQHAFPSSGSPQCPRAGGGRLDQGHAGEARSGQHAQERKLPRGREPAPRAEPPAQTLGRKLWALPSDVETEQTSGWKFWLVVPGSCEGAPRLLRGRSPHPNGGELQGTPSLGRRSFQKTQALVHPRVDGREATGGTHGGSPSPAVGLGHILGGGRSPAWSLPDA